MTDTGRTVESESRRFDHSYTWRVEYTRRDDPSKTWVGNKTVSVICERIETAIAEVYKRWPEATVIKAFRGERWGNDGVIVVDEAARSGRQP